MDKPLKACSRGMKMKAALVASLAYRPELLVMDEPFAGLDALVREEFAQGILEVAGGDRPWTVFISSHDIDEVERLADWIGIINEGRLELAEPVSSLVARFRQVEAASDGDAALPSPPAGVVAAGRGVRPHGQVRRESIRRQRVRRPRARRDPRRPRHLGDAHVAARDLHRPGAGLPARGVAGRCTVSIISHLVWHDIRALRLPLIAWLLLLLAQAAVMAFGPGLIDQEAPRATIVTFAGFLAGARLAFTTLLTVLLIQRDSPVGTTAFWLTRPIRPAAMAASKTLSAALLLVVPPAVVGWVLFTALGLPQGDVLSGVWELVLEQAMIVGLSAMGAAITATIPQFAVVAVAAVFIIGTLISEARPFVRSAGGVHAGWSGLAACQVGVGDGARDCRGSPVSGTHAGASSPRRRR